MKLAAKTKGKKGEHFKLIKDGKNLSGAIELYSVPPVTDENSHEYDFEHGLHDSEWYYVIIDEEQKQAMVNPYLAINKSSVDKNPLPTESYPKVEVIYLVYDDNKILFTKITPGNYVQNQKVAFLKNGDAQIVDRTESIELSGWVDAYYDGSKRIYFHKLEKIKNIFPGVEVFYKEASREEKSMFVETEIFENLGIDIDHVSPRIAKKIHMINESGLDFSDPDIQNTALEYAAQFTDYVKVSPEGKFVISDNKSLEAALNILNVRYYKSPFTDESFEARSIKSLA
jgi:hypothetical protein